MPYISVFISLDFTVSFLCLLNILLTTYIFFKLINSARTYCEFEFSLYSLKYIKIEMGRPLPINTILDRVHAHLLEHTWECISALDPSIIIRCARRHYSYSLPKPISTNTQEGNLRHRSNKKIKSINIVDRLYSQRPYVGNVQRIAYCICERVNVYRGYIRDHVLASGYEAANCSCKNVRLISCKTGCENSLTTSNCM